MKSTGTFTVALRKLVHYSHDRCSECNSDLPTAVAFAGYDASRKEIYVGECCKSRLHELASHIYWKLTNYPRPNSDARLWRFMDFSKFIGLLKDKALYFARADKLGDPFEGARGISTRQLEWREFAISYYRESMINLPPGVPKMKPEKIEEEAVRLYDETETAMARENLLTFVNCWHHNDVESEALWRLYSAPGSSGVCIRTTFSQLDAAISTDREVRFGHVQYIDFRKRFAGTYDRIFWKRKSLSHEAEVRAVIKKDWNDESSDSGMLVPVNIEAFVDAVIPSPFSPPWFEDVLKETIARFGFSLPTARSELLGDPFF